MLPQPSWVPSATPSCRHDQGLKSRRLLLQRGGVRPLGRTLPAAELTVLLPSATCSLGPCRPRPAQGPGTSCGNQARGLEIAFCLWRGINIT